MTRIMIWILNLIISSWILSDFIDINEFFKALKSKDVYISHEIKRIEKENDIILTYLNSYFVLNENKKPRKAIINMTHNELIYYTTSLRPYSVTTTEKNTWSNSEHSSYIQKQLDTLLCENSKYNEIIQHFSLTDYRSSCGWKNLHISILDSIYYGNYWEVNSTEKLNFSINGYSQKSYKNTILIPKTDTMNLFQEYIFINKKGELDTLIQRQKMILRNKEWMSE